MLENEFFKMQSYNAGPYPVINLSGSEKYEQNTIFRPGVYRIELAPGKDFRQSGGYGHVGYIVNMDITEVITQQFIIRAYCGSDATSLYNPGYNQYNGPFKVNAIDVNNLSVNNPIPAIDVNHIFGAGGGNIVSTGSGLMPNQGHCSGGANCLGDGNFSESYTIGGLARTSGAGSCLHLLPVGGVFGTDYIRAYHAAPVSGCGSAYGGGGIPLQSMGEKDGRWFTRGGNSPYGNGATVLGTPGSGPGAGGRYSGTNWLIGAGAYFNGTNWIDYPGSVADNQGEGLVPSSYIRITYLGPVN